MLIWRMPKRNWNFFYRVSGILAIMVVNMKLSSPAMIAGCGRGQFVLGDVCAISMLLGIYGANGDSRVAQPPQALQLNGVLIF